MRGVQMALKYALFAAAATGTNIAVQRLTLQLSRGPLSLYAAMALGTGTGLVVKYLLDKRFIFCYKAPSRTDEAGKFLLYTLMSVVTTAVFWAVELGFNSLFAFENAKYLGALVGLAIGYSLKYLLDRRFVFTKT